MQEVWTCLVNPHCTNKTGTMKAEGRAPSQGGGMAEKASRGGQAPHRSIRHGGSSCGLVWAEQSRKTLDTRATPESFFAATAL